jgi:anti-sigma factor RsiW
MPRPEREVSFESLAERIAALEAKVATCPAVAKDLRVIESQIERMEEILRALSEGSPRPPKRTPPPPGRPMGPRGLKESERLRGLAKATARR